MASAARKPTVGVITLPGCFNYGNRLQNYAVIKIWQRLGCCPESLLLAERPNFERSAKKAIKRVLGRDTTSPEDLMSPERREAFNRFDQLIPTRHLKGLDSDLAGEYDYFSVGSDQVWNPNMIVYNDDWFFLEFARREQRIAIAPSIGLGALSPKQEVRIGNGVRGFDRLSVREQRGAELLWECAGKRAEVLCDPTLVLTAQEWRRVADGRCTPGGPYVFAYLLGGSGDEASEVLEALANESDAPVVFLSDREKPGEFPAGPAEFIDLIGNATHVVTDSYHAAVFSAIMNTPLTIVHRDGGEGSLFSRLETLAKMLGIQDKIYGSPGFSLGQAGDFEGVEDAIARERVRFIAFLKGCLHA